MTRIAYRGRGKPKEETEEDFSTDEVTIKDSNGVEIILHIKKEKRSRRVILERKEIMND